MVVDGNAGCYVFQDDQVYLERCNIRAVHPPATLEFSILRENWVGVYT